MNACDALLFLFCSSFIIRCSWLFASHLYDYLGSFLRSPGCYWWSERLVVLVCHNQMCEQLFGRCLCKVGVLVSAQFI